MSAFEFNHGLIENVRPARNLVMQLRDEIVNYSHPPFRYDPELELLQEKCEQFLDNPIHKRLFDLYSLSEQVLWYHDFGCLYFGLSVKDGILGFPTLTSSFLILPTQRGESSR